MLDAKNIVELIKEISVKSVEYGEPCDFCYGKVTSINPLKVQLSQKLELGKEQLILPNHLTEYKFPLNLKDEGKVEVVVREGLKAGDNVILIKKKGGQEYLIFDRMAKV